MEDICCKTMNIDDFKGRCSSSDPGKDCQICPFINHLVNRVKNISSRLEICILDVQDFKKCRGVQGVLCRCQATNTNDGCPDLLIIYKSKRASKCYIIELKLNVKSGRIKNDVSDQLNRECGQSHCCNNSGAISKIIIVKDEDIARKMRNGRNPHINEIINNNIMIVSMCDVGNIFE
jgi:hypothetical protein